MRRAGLYMMVWLVMSCTGGPTVPAPVAPQQPPPRELKVLLYPYIPDAGRDKHAALRQRITQEFQARHPDIRLRVELDRRFNPYDFDKVLPQLFSPDGFHVIELETVLFGALIQRGWLAPLPSQGGDIFPEALRSATVNGQLYGIPTWLCSRFLFSPHPQLLPADGAARLVDLWHTLGLTPPYLIGDFSGSWVLPELYIKAYVDTYGYERVQEALRYPLDETVVRTMAPVMQGCAVQGTNKCLDTSYEQDYGQDSNPTTRTFAAGQAASFIDFSESLYYLERDQPGSSAGLHAMLPPLGQGNASLIWIDALVINAQSCQGACQADALAFAAYLNSPETRRWIALSGEAPAGTPPRYLLPATQAFYHDAEVQRYPHYLAFRELIAGARAYPNQGLPEMRKQLQCALLAAFQQPPDARCPTTPSTSRH